MYGAMANITRTPNHIPHRTISSFSHSYSPGLGCQLMGDLVSKTADEAVSIEEYVAFVSEFINTDTEREAVVNFKQCFLNQDNKTLENFLALEVMLIMFYAVNHSPGRHKLFIYHQ